MGKKSILEEIQELISDWTTLDELSNAFFENANAVVLNWEEVDESDIADLEQLLAATDDMKKLMNEMYEEHMGFFEAFIKSGPVLKRCADDEKEGDRAKKHHPS